MRLDGIICMRRDGMNAIQRSWYVLRLRVHFIDLRGDAYQDFFHNVMGRRYPNDFIPTRPWGNLGDRKNDGYLKSKRILYQVYGPDDVKLSDTIDKIDEDFNGALPYWKDHFDGWTFVHNARRALASDVVKHLMELEQKHAPLTVRQWGYPELRHEVLQLKDEDLIDLLGAPVDEEVISRVRMEDLQPVLVELAKSEPPLEGDIRPVSGKKLKWNQLSPDAEGMLVLGMRRAALVKKFFDEWPDPTIGDRVAAGFKAQYRKLRDANAAPDDILAELQMYADGGVRGHPRRQGAVLAVLAHLFESCDIFEELPESVAMA